MDTIQVIDYTMCSLIPGTEMACILMPLSFADLALSVL